MSNKIRIGTRDSQLALWQANMVKTELERLGHTAELIKVKSTGDIVLNKPLYELGITGIFTRNLDIALLNEDIDIAVHSLKDVPTILPKGITQAAVLKRGNVLDVLVYKENLEFLKLDAAMIATGSLRRKAQWLNRYPNHIIENLRGNVNTRLRKIQSNNWHGGILAAAGMDRIGLRPKNALDLEWMIPAPAQGAIMIATLHERKDILAICESLNDRETEICTRIERSFLNKLEGGCTAPIGAIATIRNKTIDFRGVLLSEDGREKVTVQRTVTLEEEQDLGASCAKEVIKNGGEKILNNLDKRQYTGSEIFSTKLLTKSQMLLFNETLDISSRNCIKVNTNRIPLTTLNKPLNSVIITSKNAVTAILESFSPTELRFKNIYCVGRRTKRLVEDKIGTVTYTAKNASILAEYLISNLKEKEVTYFCSDIRLDDIPVVLSDNGFKVNEVFAYSTTYDAVKVSASIDGVMFYSPSTVESFVSKNDNNFKAFCIGPSTAKVAKKYFKEVYISKVPTMESVIELVNQNYVQN